MGSELSCLGISIWTSYCGATFAIQSKYPDSKTWEEIGGKAGTHEIDRDGTKEKKG